MPSTLPRLDRARQPDNAVRTFAEIGLLLAETKALLAKLQASVLCGQVAEHAAYHRVCAACGARQVFKDRRTRQLQTLFGTVDVEVPRFKMCRCCRPTAMAIGISPACLAQAHPASRPAPS